MFSLLFPSLVTVYIINRNKKLTNLLNKVIIYNICGWNISHIIAHYILCVSIVLDNKSKLRNIVIFDICWYLLEYLSYKITHKNKINRNKTKEQIYENVYKPRLDDFVFNFLGIYLYTKTHNKIIFNRAFYTFGSFKRNSIFFFITICKKK